VVRTRRSRSVRAAKESRRVRTSFQMSYLSVVPLLEVGSISTLRERESFDLRVGHGVAVC